MKRNQKGITLLSFLFVLALVGFFGFLFMRFFPVYTEYFSAVNDIKAVTQATGADKQALPQLRNSLYRRFQISYVDSVNLEKHIKLRTEKEGGKVLDLNYEVRKPLIYNLDFVAKFERSFPVTGRPDAE